MIAQEIENEETKKISDQTKKEIRAAFLEVYPNFTSAKTIPVQDLTASLK
jgi:hypothetical protein